MGLRSLGVQLSRTCNGCKRCLALGDNVQRTIDKRSDARTSVAEGQKSQETGSNLLIAGYG